MNYWFRYATLGWLQGTVSTRAFVRAITDYYQRYGHEAANRSWNILSTHDTPRLRDELPDAAIRELALVLQFTLPGEPLVYYGEETGMEGGGDPHNRRTMQWDEANWDQATLRLHKKLIEIGGRVASYAMAGSCCWASTSMATHWPSCALRTCRTRKLWWR